MDRERGVREGRGVGSKKYKLPAIYEGKEKGKGRRRTKVWLSKGG